MSQTARIDQSALDVQQSILVGVREADLDPDPFKQFEQWYRQAQAASVPQPDAMALATATRDGRPSVRWVLLKDFGENGFVFYTNYESRKGRELAENSLGALAFYWPELHRQIRIEGRIEKVSVEESERYFHSRPRGSQLGAAVSRQSEVVPSREALEQRLQQLETAYEGQDVPLPACWGGYRLVPDLIEFWQSRLNRLHDRLRYTRQPDQAWRIERLAP